MARRGTKSGDGWAPSRAAKKAGGREVKKLCLAAIPAVFAGNVCAVFHYFPLTRASVNLAPAGAGESCLACTHLTIVKTYYDRRNLSTFFQKGRGPGKRRGLLSQYLVNERDRYRPFADSRGDAFDVAATNIPGSENSGHTAFQQVGPTGERPVRAGQLF